MNEEGAGKEHVAHSDRRVATSARHRVVLISGAHFPCNDSSLRAFLIPSIRLMQERAKKYAW